MADNAEAHLERGIAALAQGRLDDAEMSFIEAASRAPPRSYTSGRAFGNLAAVSFRRCDHGQALALSEKALDAFREAGDTEKQAVVLINMAKSLELSAGDASVSVPGGGSSVSPMERAVQCMTEAASLTSDAKRREEAHKWLSDHAERLTAMAERGVVAGAPSPATTVKRSTSDGGAPGASAVRFTPCTDVDVLAGLKTVSSQALRSPVASAHTHFRPGAHTVSSTPMLEYGFENLWFGDILARCERGAAVLDAIDALIRSRAQASDGYSRTLAEAAATANSVLSTTGAGISAFVHGAKPSSTATAAVASAVRSAWSSLVGSSSTELATLGLSFADPAAAAHHEEPAAPSATVMTGGFDTLTAALAATRRSYLRDATSHSRLAAGLRDVSQQLQAFKVTYAAKVQKLLARGSDTVRATQQTVNNLKRANQQLERARRELEDAAERLTSALQSAGAVPDAELQRRQKRYAEATNVARSGEDAVRDAADAVVSSRKQRDDDLTGIARQLQRLDEERHSALARALLSVTSITAATCDAASEGAARAQVTASAVDVASDVRTFIHQRRVAVMLDEYQARHGGPTTPAASTTARQRSVSSNIDLGDALRLQPSSSSLDPDDVTRVLPSPLSIPAMLKHHRDYLTTEAELAPMMFKWVIMLTEGRGSETLYGKPLDDAAAAAVAKPSQSKPAGDVPADASSGGEAAITQATDPVFEVSLLEQQAARHAFLRALSARRAIVQLLPDAAFRRMVRVFWWLLDACASQEDARAAQTVLILAETYHHRTLDADVPSRRTDEAGSPRRGDAASDAGTKASEGAEWVKVDASEPSTLAEGDAAAAPAGDKVFVQKHITSHPIWQADFWQEAFYRAVRDEIAKIIDPQSASNTRLTNLFAVADADMAAAEGRSPDAKPAAPDVRSPRAAAVGAFSLSTDAEAQYAYTQIVFGQLMALAVNMLSFGMPREEAEGIISRLATSNGLPREQVEMLRETIASH